jgi:hypothetical protein
VTWLLYIAWCAGVTLLAYGSALTLPFFFDDFVHIPFVDAHSLSEIWGTAGQLTYYRPLPFTIWKLMFAATGVHSQLLQHGFNLVLHAFNGLLVGWLAAELFANNARVEARPWHYWPRAFLSAGLFLLFPFSYQAVPWAGSLAHLLVTNLILLSLSTYWLMRRTGRRSWGALSLVLAFLAPFAHENGVLVGPLLAAILFTGSDYKRNARSHLKQVLLWTLPALIWLPIWWFAPKAGGGVGVVGLEAIMQNGAYFAQGVAYPLTWLGGRLRTVTEISDMGVTAVLGAVALLGAALIQWCSRAGRRSLLPWLWCLIAALPSILFLSFDYVINGPRLLMLLSVGAAWLWADVAIQAAGWMWPVGGRRRWLRLALVVAVLLVVLAQNLSFVRRRMRLHEMLGTTHKQAVSLATAANEAGSAAVFVNLPAWLAPGEITYALGHEGVQFWPHYAHPENLVQVNSGRPASLLMLRIQAIRPEMPYFYNLSGPSTSNWAEAAALGPAKVFVADYSPEGVVMRPAGTLRPPLSEVQPLASYSTAENDSAITLLDAHVENDGAKLQIDLTWQVNQIPPEQTTIFVHVVDEEGQLIAQLDGDPLGGSYPLSQWEPGTAAVDRRSIELDSSDVTILVGLYDRLTGERLPAVSAVGSIWPDGAALIDDH